MPDKTPDGVRPALIGVTSATHARFVSDLRASLTFYVDLAELPLLAIFPSSEEPTGAILKLTDGCLLELLQESPLERCHPSSDHIILHMADAEAGAAFAQRFEDLGIMPVPPINPYWRDRGRAFSDPDGRQLVIVIGEAG